jgi:two-component sensor histidine kinase
MTRTQKFILNIVAITCLLVSGKIAFAQAYRFNHPDLKDAATSSFLYRAFEDSKGYIWLISYKAVTRFDGKKHKTFGPDDGYYETGAYRILEDAEGIIWVLTVNFKLYYFKDNVFREIPQKIHINWIYADERGQKWAFSREKGVTYKIGENQILRPVYSYSKWGNCYACHIINDSTHLLSLTTGMWLWEHNKLRMITQSHMFNHHMPARYFRVRNKILVTNEVGIHEWKNNKLNFLTTLDDTTEVFDILLDSVHHYVWVATSKGLLRYNNEISNSSAKKWFLHDKSVLSISPASDGNLWVTTSNSGTYVFNPNALHVTGEQGLYDEDVRQVEKESGIMYFFTRYSPYYRFVNDQLEKVPFPRPRKKGEWIKSPHRVSALSDTSLLLLSTHTMIISRGKAYLYPYKEGEAAIRFISNNWHVIAMPDFSINANNKVLIDSTRWCNFLYGTLKKQKLESEALNQAAYVDRDTVYMTCKDGVLKCYWIGNEPQVSIIKMAGPISYITMWKRSLIVGTQTNGIYVYHHGTLTNYNDQNGLLSNYCFTLTVRDNEIWASTSNGLSCINLLNGSIRNYTVKDYLVDNEVNNVGFLGDTIFVATTKGVSYFNIYDELPFKAPSVFIENVLINNKPAPIAGKYDLTYAENNISFMLCSPGYRSADFNRFRVIVEHDRGIDTTIYKDGQIQLLALMPGQYLMRADVMDMNGMWSRKPVEISFNIAPPFWRSWWFIVLVGMILLNIIGYIVWLTVKRQKDAQEYQRKIVESELRSLRLYMNPHFLFNSLASLQAFVLTRKNDEANTFITKFSKLIRSVMTYSIRGELKLSEEIALLQSYLELESIRFNHEFTFEVNADGNIETEEITIPSLIIQPFVENAIKHGVTGTGRKCYIKVRFFMRNSELFCRVEDNGKGRTEKSVKDTNHISSGVSFTVERIRLLVHKRADEVISFRDTNADVDVRGTTVEVLVPVLNKHSEE